MSSYLSCNHMVRRNPRFALQKSSPANDFLLPPPIPPLHCGKAGGGSRRCRGSQGRLPPPRTGGHAHTGKLPPRTRETRWRTLRTSTLRRERATTVDREEKQRAAAGPVVVADAAGGGEAGTPPAAKNRRPCAYRRAAAKNEGEEVADAEDEHAEERVGRRGGLGGGAEGGVERKEASSRWDRGEREQG
uniref:Uncharacterized protein n=1 Tax=Oryza glumipatula TaxID=40148 RepID=A0A0E0A1B3_9ORYZ